MQLVKEHKYYEANVALKAAEDGLIVTSVSLVDTVDYKSAKGPRQKELAEREKRKAKEIAP